MQKKDIIAAIRRAAKELGRTPSRGELNRITGVNYYRVQLEFPTFQQAVRAAGLEPHPKGRKIQTKDLLRDWRRVKKKVGRRPTRAEYMREGKYSAAALKHRFGSWANIGGAVIMRRPRQPGRKPRVVIESPHPEEKRGELQPADSPDKMIAMQWASSLTQIPAELAGKRRVTEAIAAMIVNTLLGDRWQITPTIRGASFVDQEGLTTKDTKEHEESRDRTGKDNQEFNGTKDFISPSCSLVPFVVKNGLKRDRALLGPPFDRSPLTNAPVNELGVVFLFAIFAHNLGFQVESLQGNFPDCEARREVQPGRWQRQRIEFEYESKNFSLHGHDPKQCDVIVCWRHNWTSAPENLEIIALERFVRM